MWQASGNGSAAGTYGISLVKLLAEGKTFTRNNSSKNSGKSSSLRAGYFSLSHSSYKRGTCAAGKRERALYAGWSVWSPKSEHAGTFTWARDLKLTRQGSCNNNKHNAKSEGGDFTQLDFTLVQARE